NAGAGKLRAQAPQRLGGARGRGPQDHGELARFIVAFDALDDRRHELEMPIDVGLFQIPRQPRTDHNAHVPPRSVEVVRTNAKALAPALLKLAAIELRKP